MEVSRRQFLASGITTTIGATGLYGLIDGMIASASAAMRPSPLPPPPPPPPVRAANPAPNGGNTGTAAIPTAGEQYLFAPRVIQDNGVMVISPPLHHAVVTALVTALVTAPVTAAAQASLESVLTDLENDGLIDFTASGAGVTVAWGASYFASLPNALTARYMPIDLVTSAASGSTVPALVDAISFASDPSGVVLESNDVAVVIASDSLANVNTCIDAIFSGSVADLFQVTSIRRGFVDASQLGGTNQSLTKQMALAAGIRGANLMPNQAELFLGFTSTQRNALAPSNVANLETLPGITNQFPNGYFVQGTTMHLSHIEENLTAWYAKSYPARGGAAFTSQLKLPASPQNETIPAVTPENEAQVQSQLSANGYIGHASSMQPISRLLQPTRDNYGVPWPTGTAIPSRADFNTLDNPFSFSSNPSIDNYSTNPAAGVHFVAYMPTSSMFQRMRQAMDGQYADRQLGSAAVNGPFNSVLRTTHRQNFLVPPKAHRSFPLAELL